MKPKEVKPTVIEKNGGYQGKQTFNCTMRGHLSDPMHRKILSTDT